MYFALSCGVGTIAAICFSILLFGHKIVDGYDNKRNFMEKALGEGVIFLLFVGTLTSGVSVGLMMYSIFG